MTEMFLTHVMGGADTDAKTEISAIKQSFESL